VRGGNAEDYLDLKKKAGFCVEESGCPGFVDLWGESDGSEIEEGIGSGVGGTSRPATNMTGASWTNNSGGYEFMLRSWSSEEV
jgi:hypothetical protein